jgi:hypothetical protein
MLCPRWEREEHRPPAYSHRWSLAQQAHSSLGASLRQRADFLTTECSNSPQVERCSQQAELWMTAVNLESQTVT